MGNISIITGRGNMESCFTFISQALSRATLVSHPFGCFLGILIIGTQACIFYICECHSSSSCCDKHPYKSSLIKKSLVPGSSSPRQKSHGSRAVRGLSTLNPQCGVREQWSLVLHALSPFYTGQDKSSHFL